MKRWMVFSACVLAWWLWPSVGWTAEKPSEQLLCSFSTPKPVVFEKQDITFTIQDNWLVLTTGHKNPWPGITLKVPGRPWDLSAFEHVAVDVKNLDAQPVEVACRVDNAGADGKIKCVTGQIRLGPNGQGTLQVPLTRRMPEKLRGKLFGMRGYPGGWSDKGIDPRAIEQVIIFVSRPTTDHHFQLARLRAGGQYLDILPQEETKLFPLIDAYGQYVHKDWPGKVHKAEELAARRDEEARDLEKHPGPQGWDQYGGWKAGPQLQATGRFRVEKYQGQWWLVDPEGRLFWSHGIDCVGTDNATPTTDREYLFADLPARDAPLGQFRGQGRWGPHNYYENKTYETFNFTGANLLRKYGPDWRQDFFRIAQRRLRSWGMNTIGNWSDPSLGPMHQTPYVVTVHVGGRLLEGSQGYWGQFVDPFDPQFTTSLRRQFARRPGPQAGDPWCLGYFLGNEMSWGEETSLAEATLASGVHQPAKKAFIGDLKSKYATIERLNAAWGTAHKSWEGLGESRTPPDRKKAHDDLAAFATRLAELFFQGCRDAVKQADPQGLYLGCRFAWSNDRAVQASAQFCDVISFNRYQRSVADLRLPAGVDRPILIGEFHFGALDRGLFHTGLVPTANQEERARAYKDYVRSALHNPWLVGTHWFQYTDQATTGRGDGENYQIGFVDICDTPYPETIKACREVGSGMYHDRLDAGAARSSTAEVEVYTQNKRLGRGVNILGYDRLWRSRDRARFQDRHFRLIKEAGFDSVRINLHPFRDARADTEQRLSKTWLDTLDWAVQQALANHLLPILDFHEFQALGTNPEKNKDRFLATWRQIAEHCQKAPPEVIFEILNEPNQKLTPKLWNQYLREALALIRQSNPTRTVIVGPASWNSIDLLEKLELPESDRDLIVTVHYYSPFPFTHQGASWTGQRNKVGVAWLGTDKEKQAIAHDFDRAQAWAEKHHRPLFLGEFGAYDRGDMASRVRWTEFVARQAEKRGWSWAYWQFDNDFIVYDMGKQQWVEPIRNALVPPRR